MVSGVSLRRKLAALGDGDVASLFGTDQDDCVGFPDSMPIQRAAVARTELFFKVAGFGEWELNAGVGDATVGDDHAEVVQGRVGPERWY